MLSALLSFILIANSLHRQLTAYRKFRKQWLDNAVIGLQSEGPSKSASWPKDVPFGNVIVHAIDSVLVPGAYTGSR